MELLFFPRDAKGAWVPGPLGIYVYLCDGDFAGDARAVFEKWAALWSGPVRLTVGSARYLAAFHEALGDRVEFIGVDLAADQSAFDGLDWPALRELHLDECTSRPGLASLMRRPLQMLAISNEDADVDVIGEATVRELSVSLFHAREARLVRRLRVEHLEVRRSPEEGAELLGTMPSVWKVIGLDARFADCFPQLREFRCHSSVTSKPARLIRLVNPAVAPYLCRVELQCKVSDRTAVPLLARDLSELHLNVETGFAAVNKAVATSRCLELYLRYVNCYEYDFLGWVAAMQQNTVTRSASMPSNTWGTVATKRAVAGLLRVNRTLQHLSGRNPRQVADVLQLLRESPNRVMWYTDYEDENAARVCLSSEAWSQLSVVVASMRANRAHALRDFVFRPDCLGAIMAMRSASADPGENQRARVKHVRQMDERVVHPWPMIMAQLPDTLGSASRLFDAKFVQREIAAEPMRVEQPRSKHGAKRKPLIE